VTPFDGDHPFSFQIDNLESGYPVLVDFQLRPANPDHLGYAMSVLDWPGGDVEGQIQRFKQTTFADGMTKEEVEANPTSQNGDMRLIPMLELEISGNASGYQVPFKLTSPEATLAVRGAISVTVTLTPGAEDSTKTDLAFDLGSLGGAIFTLYEGTCAEPGNELAEYLISSEPDAEFDGGLLDLADGNHVMVVESDGASECAAVPNVVNGGYTDRMIDPEPLAPYGISVREADDAGTLLAYVPLSVVADETGGGKAAFSARMIYWPGLEGDWQRAQKARVVWLVQVLTDVCDPTGFEPSGEAENDASKRSEELDAWCMDAAHRTADATEIVHTYHEEWVLTGMGAREDHGLDVSVVWEDPANDADRQADAQLWQLARGLADSFVPGRDCDDEVGTNDPDYDPDATPAVCHADGKRDIVVAERNDGNLTLSERFGNPGVLEDGDDRRWGIAQNALGAETFSYDHEDYVAKMMMEETPRILSEAFDAYRDDTTPTLLFAREDTYRSVNLASATGGGDAALTLDFDSLALDTMASLKWTPYRYNGDTDLDGNVIGWEPYPMVEYWDVLESRYMEGLAEYLEAKGDPLAANDDYVTGAMVVARSVYVSFYSGFCELVRVQGALSWSDTVSAGSADINLAKLTLSVATGQYGIIMDFVQSFAEQADKMMAVLSIYDITRPAGGGESFLKIVGAGFKGIGTSWLYNFHPANTFGQLGALGKAGLGVMVGVALAAVALTVWAAAKGESGWDIAAKVISGVGIVFALKGLLSAVKAAVEATKTIKEALQGTTQAIKNAFKSIAVVGLILGVVATWAMAIVTIALSNMTRQQLGTAIAAAIASTIVQIIMFVINAIPIVGAIISAVISLIDALVSAICGVLPKDMQESKAASWLCGGIQGVVSKALEVLIFSATVMVDLKERELEGGEGPRLRFSGIDSDDFVYPERGFSVGQEIRYGVAFTNTIDLVGLPDNIGAAYRYQYNDKNLRSSTFEYRLDTAETDFHDDLDRGTLSGQWAYEDGDGPEWGDVGHTWRAGEPVYITRSPYVADAVALRHAGVNQPTELYLSEAFAIPSQNCILGVCTIWTERATRHYDLSESIKLDIFPASLDEFYALDCDARGCRQAWGQSGDLKLPTLRDADSDGLPFGADPNDTLWDSDGDGLSDLFERQIGSNPDSGDSDGDGLGDYEEVRTGTSASRPDTDGDGLMDGEEVLHRDAFDQDGDGDKAEWVGGWSFVYSRSDDGTALFTWVTSDPLSVDADQDMLIDVLEKTYGFNPRVPSTSQVLTLESQVKEIAAGGVYTTSDGFVKPGDSFFYEATVRNELANRYAQGLLDSSFPGAVTDTSLPPEAFILQPEEEETLSGEVAVKSSATSGVYSFTQVAGAVIVDWSSLAGDAVLWLPFEDPITSTTYADRSGSLPPHDGFCAAGTCAPVKDDGRYGGALSLSADGYVTSALDVPETAYGVSFWFKTDDADGGLAAVDDADGAQVYLDGGDVCAKVPYLSTSAQAWETVCSSGTVYADATWHHVVHTFGTFNDGSSGQRLYADGALVGRGDRTPEDYPTEAGLSLGRCQGVTARFEGLIDETRVYEDALEPAEVEALFRQPVLYMTFDRADPLVDDSMFENDGSSRLATRPGSGAGIVGKASDFNGGQLFNVGPYPSLDLSNGRFTLSAWVYPRPYTNDQCLEFHQYYKDRCELWQPQGILGYESGQAAGYPTLQRVDVRDAGGSVVEHRLRFGFGTGSDWSGYWESGDALTPNAWNHVTLTFDEGTVKLYVNGRLVDQDAGFFTDVPGDTQRLTVGRSGSRGTVSFDGMYVTDHSEGVAVQDAELCVAANGVEIFNKTVERNHDTDDDGYIDAYDFDAEVAFQDMLTVRMWEDDGGTRCGAARDDNDDNIGSWIFRTTEAGTSRPQGSPYTIETTQVSFSGEVDGRYWRVYENESVPFDGKIDELSIYRQVLDDWTIEELYWAGSTALHLRLDDPPGETSFSDATGQQDGACSADWCPTSGVPGRVNRAALFDSHQQDRISVPHSSANELTRDFSLAAWIKPEALSGVQRILATSREESDDGFGFGTSGRELVFSVHGGEDYTTTDAWLEAGEWAHVAAVVDGENLVTFYVNGQWEGAKAIASPITVDLNDELLIGGGGSAASGNLTELFGGVIDDVVVLRRALSANDVTALYREAPILHLRFEEEYGATLLADSSGNGHDGTCDTGTEEEVDHCPQVGPAIQGWMGLGAAFDGRGDKVVVSDTRSLDLNAVTVGAWVRPDERRALSGL